MGALGRSAGTAKRTSWTRQQRSSDVARRRSARCPRCCAWCCSRRCSASAPIWSSSSRRRPASSSPARSCVARAGAGRPRDRQLERLRRRAPELAARSTSCFAAVPAGARPMPLPRARRRRSRSRASSVGAARRRSGSLSRTSPSRSGRATGSASSGRAASGKSSLARALVGVWPPVARQGPARRRRPRPVVARGARPAYRLPAAGRRAVRRHGRREHRALRSRTPSPRRSSRRPRPPACTT